MVTMFYSRLMDVRQGKLRKTIAKGKRTRENVYSLKDITANDKKR